MKIVPNYSTVGKQIVSESYMYEVARTLGVPIRIAEAHRGDEKRFVVRADASLTAFLELESAICVYGELV